MTEKNDSMMPEHKAEEFMQIFKKGAEFTQDLLKENEKLRYQVLQLKEALGQEGKLVVGGSTESEQMLKRLEELEKEKQEILDRFRVVEAENQEFANRYVDVENENNMLANLYIASYQLHSTLDFREVLQIIMEIVINLIGAEEFGVLLLDEKTNKLEAVSSEGVSLSVLPRVEIGKGVIGETAKSGESYFTEDLKGYEVDYNNPMVCIPLKIKEHVIGVIAIYKLLVQKDKFVDVDYELFTLLAGHSATAIFSSKLYSESERKLSTIQGFIDLMTK